MAENSPRECMDHPGRIFQYGLTTYNLFAGELFRCLKYPAINTALDKTAREVIEWQNEVLLDITEGFFKTINYDLKQFVVSPDPERENSGTFCPRCFNQFYDLSGECPDCPGVKLLSFCVPQNGNNL